MPSAEIIAIGTELLLGEAADTNTRFIARSLRQLGIDLFRSHIIGDNAGRIAESVRQALERADIVITTGGLGPTVDDPTRQAIADSLGLELEYHPELWEQIHARITRYGRSPTDNQKRQAYLPRTARVVENPVGTAPAFIVTLPPEPPTGLPAAGAKMVIALPGVPREMETLLVDAILPFLQSTFILHSVIKIRSLHVSGMGEGVIDDQVGDLELLSNPTVGLTAHSGVVNIRIAAKADTVEQADQLIAPVEIELRSRLGDNIFGVDEDTLEDMILSILALRGWTLACFESNLQAALSSRLAAIQSPVYLGMVESPDYDPALVEKTTAAMDQFDSHVALGVSLQQQADRHVIDIQILTPLGGSRHQLSYGGHPRNARRWAANMALDGLRRFILEKV
jgi:nicotinamide-nucleotide amidase